MSKHFAVIFERRYAQCPRRYVNEYCWGNDKWLHPSTKGMCSTLVSAKKHATAAIDVWGYSSVRIFDRLTGKYIRTYKRSSDGIIIHEGMVK